MTRRGGLWLTMVGGAITVAFVFLQAFSISAYARGAGDGALDLHGWGSLFVHIGELAIVIGVIWGWWGNAKAIGLAVAFLVLSFGQLAALGDTEETGSWINGLHGFLALVILTVGAIAFHRGRRELGLGQAAH